MLSDPSEATEELDRSVAILKWSKGGLWADPSAREVRIPNTTNETIKCLLVDTGTKIS